MNITTHNFSDESKFAPGGIWSNHPDDVAANFPGCKVLFHQDDIANGGNVWRDRIGDLVMTASGANIFTKDSLGVRLDAGSIVTTGSYPQLSMVADKKDFVVALTGTIDTATRIVELGDAVTGQGIALKGGTNEFLTFDNLNYHQLGTLPMAYPIHALTAHADISANDTFKHGANAAGTEIGTIGKAGGSALTIDQDWTGFAIKTVMSTSATVGYKMITIFLFETPPSDVALANAWMAANPNKFWPGWAGKR